MRYVIKVLNSELIIVKNVFIKKNLFYAGKRQYFRNAEYGMIFLHNQEKDKTYCYFV